MSMCTRPLIETQTIAGREIARCLTCSRISPPDQADEWASEHRDQAADANTAIDRAVAS